jgi:hypothetical protein
MRHVTATVIAAVVMMTAPVLLAQTPMKPTAPGTAGDPHGKPLCAWTSTSFVALCPQPRGASARRLP